MKVILFDVWTKGLIHFPRLLDEFNKQNINLTLVHAGSYGNEIREHKSEKIDDIPVHDISSFDSLDDCIKMLNPDVILFLSLDTLFTRAINRYAQTHNLPTVNLYHGLHSAFDSLKNLKTNYFARFLDIFPRILINKRFLFFYLNILVKTDLTIKDLINITHDVLLKMLGRDISVARLDGNPNFICLFNNYELVEAKKKYTSKRVSFHEIGIPDLYKFKGLSKVINSYNTELKKHMICTYVGTGPRSTNMLLSDNDEYFEHITEINNFLTDKGYLVNFKLHHSRLNSIEHLNEINNNKINLINDDEFVNSLRNSKFSIIEPSSASLAPAIIGMPIVLSKVLKLSNLKFGKLFNEYPRSFQINTLNELSIFLDELEQGSFKMEKIDKWLVKSLGPMPLDDLPKRVAKVMFEAGYKTDNSKQINL